MIAVLAGGTGAAKFIRGLVRVVPASDLAVVVNTGDDLDWWGLRVCPDLDTITYCLAGLLDRSRGWGVLDDSFACRDQINRFGEPTWFNVGDRDLALHLFRTRLLRAGQTLTQTTQRIAQRLGVPARILPMSDQPVRTVVKTPGGDLSFQEFFVRDRFEPQVEGVSFEAEEGAEAGPAVVETIQKAGLVIIAPSNPITSVGPILFVPGIREALRNCPAPVVAVSPIVGSAAVSGPAAKLMRASGYQVSPAGVVEAYRDFLDLLVADAKDAPRRAALEGMGVHVRFTDTIMRDPETAELLARFLLAEHP